MVLNGGRGAAGRDFPFVYLFSFRPYLFDLMLMLHGPKNVGRFESEKNS